MGYKLFLDDVRMPSEIYIKDSDDDWVIARNYDEFVTIISRDGAPDIISFDHDLGMVSELEVEHNGYYCAWWLINNNIPIKEYKVHSANPIGAENIRRLLHNWLKHCEEQEDKK